VILIHPNLYKDALEAFPIPTMIVNESGALDMLNQHAALLFKHLSSDNIGDNLIDIISCPKHDTAAKPGYHPTECEDCLVTHLEETLSNKTEMKRRPCQMNITYGTRTEKLFALFTAAPFIHNRNQHFLITIDPIVKLAEQNHYVSICAYCQKLKDTEGNWQHLADFFSHRVGITLSHGICPQCVGDNNFKQG